MNAINKGLTVPLSLVVFLNCSLLLNAQMLADFETPETSPQFTAEGATAVVANPDKTGINSSDSVGFYNKIEGNWHYVSLHFPDTVKIRHNNTLTFKLRTSTQGRIYAKFYNGSDVVIEHWAPEWNFKPTPNTWTECAMDMTDAMGKQFTMLQLAACVDNTAEANVWFDDVQLTNPDAGDGTPVLLFTVSDRSIVLGEEITFDATESYDFDGEIVDYHWDYGDGNSGSGSVASHTYTSDSVYTVTLTITDNDGKTAAGSEMIFVIHPDDGLSHPVFVTSEPETHQKIETIFQSRKQYGNAFDPDQVKIDAMVTYPDGDSALIPCFFYVPVNYIDDNWMPDPDHRSWMLRFMSEQEGTHSVKFIMADMDGTWSSEPYHVEVTSGNSRGVVREDPDNRQYFRHSTGEPFYPMGINIGWNSIENYTQILNNLSAGRANTFRYWHTPFAWQALEWSEDYHYNYKGLGIYNQEAAAMSDSIVELSESLDMYMQLAIFQHGPFSENVDAMWDTNPYNSANGGYIDQAEEFFYNDSCILQTKKLLRYIVARWAYSSNLFAWEFFNEVQFTGMHNSQSDLWFPGVVSWHSEMSRYMESIDPYNHLQTTSAATGQLAVLDTIETLDNLQYHLYDEESTLLNTQIGLDYRFRNELTHSSIINGEYGTRNAADTPFDMQRNAIWNGIMTRVPRYMWIWEHYLDPSWAGLFSMPGQYLEDEILALEEDLKDHTFTTAHPDKQFRSLGMAGDSSYYGYIYDPGNGMNIAGATLTIGDLPIANYSMIFYLPVSGEVIENDSIALIEGTHMLDLPTFSKGIAFKVKYHSDYLLPLANAGNDTVVAVGMPVIVTGKLSSSPVTETLTYHWSLEEKPEGSAVNIADSTAMQFQIVPDMAGIYRFNLVVGDGQNTSVPDQLVVRGSLPPVAVAPSDTTVSIKETYVRLNGSGSYDPDGDELLFSWVLLSAPEESEKMIYEEDSHEVILKTDAEGMFVIELTVSDGVSESQPDTVNVTVVSDGTGLANSGSAEDFNIFPNPTSGKLLISSLKNDQVEKIEIIDLNGQVLTMIVPPHTLPADFEIDLRKYTHSGQLLVIRITVDQKIICKKVLIQ
ncbi:MAG: PKD domain-containing protein [Bacteroidales bacterium]|nr:PKD domain-containing protein [Bacteroidales bacterium]